VSALLLFASQCGEALEKIDALLGDREHLPCMALLEVGRWGDGSTREHGKVGAFELGQRLCEYAKFPAMLNQPLISLERTQKSPGTDARVGRDFYRLFPDESQFLRIQCGWAPMMRRHGRGTVCEERNVQQEGENPSEGREHLWPPFTAGCANG
jgi:hypothetical protein